VHPRIQSLTVVALAAGPASGQVRPPAADHHQHLFSPPIVTLLSGGSGGLGPITARDLVTLLDSAGIRRAVVLSVAYMYGSPARVVEDEHAKVRAENDWTAAQAAEFPERLRAFCSFNPLKEYALEELARCAANPGLRHGIKLHFGNSDVQLEDPTHLELVRGVFRAANQHRMAVVVHLRASISRRRPYGRDQAVALLREVLPVAPNIPVQIAHLAGSGPGYDDPAADSVLAVLAEAVASRDPRTSQLWFDVTTLANAELSAASAGRLVERLRRLGMERIVYGSDAAAGPNLRPREGWAAFRRLPLTDQELATIASNVAPYLR
jgi:predicted TIM-barrel fold metal-dependent hydrolase